MSLLVKVRHRTIDPVFYRKVFRDLARPFRKFLDQPAPLDLESQDWKIAVCVVAHPDDETFCSGLLAGLVNQGVEVRLLCLTRGEGGPTGGLARSRLGPAREQEMRSACRELGISEVHFLGHVDPLARPYRVFAPSISSRKLASQIETELDAADLILSHGSSGEYWHPAHLLVFDTVQRWIRQNPSRPDWLTFLARQPDHEIPRLINWDDEANLCLDVSSYRQIREKALTCHQTQLGLFAKFGGGDYRDFIRKTSLETYHRAGY